LLNLNPEPMQYDIDESLRRMAAEPWDLVLTISGEPRRTRALSVEQMGLLRGLERMRSDAERYAAVAGLFEPPLPAEMVAEWDAALAGAVVSAIVAYQQGRVEKNCRRVAADVAAALKKPTS
jgi:hypothetical protein